MFQIGFPELLTLLVLMLLLVGPKRLPEVTKFFIQMNDNYTFIPNNIDYKDISSIRTKLSKMIMKIDWGMIWCI